LVYFGAKDKTALQPNAIKTAINQKVSNRGKHEVYDRPLTGTQVDFQ
jgi:hypothetical protein